MIFKYMKGDPLRIAAFIIAAIVCVFFIRGLVIRHNKDTEGLKMAFCDGFIEATEENLSVSLNRTVRLDNDQKQAIKGIFDRSISVSHIMEIADSEDKVKELEQSEDFINIICGMMKDDDRQIYEDICLSYTEELTSVSENNYAEK